MFRMCIARVQLDLNHGWVEAVTMVSVLDEKEGNIIFCINFGCSFLVPPGPPEISTFWDRTQNKGRGPWMPASMVTPYGHLCMHHSRQKENPRKIFYSHMCAPPPHKTTQLVTDSLGQKLS